MLLSHCYKEVVEAGCDEAGRGCLAGSVYAAAVILPPDYDNPALNDSKKLTDRRRHALREQIERDALAWAVGIVTPDEIDKINILHASFLAMHRAIDQLQLRPEALIIDGNRFDPYRVGEGLPDEGKTLPYTCIVKYPAYDWQSNKGYPTRKHREAIRLHGITPFHRRSYNLLGTDELEINFEEQDLP